MLPIEQARNAYRVGQQRSRAARARDGHHKYGWQPSAKEQRHVDGMSAVAECLVAAMTGRPWTSAGMTPDAPGAGDIGGGIQVRWTAHRHGCLIVHPEESADQIYVLVRGPTWPLEIAGWAYGWEAKQPQYWRSDVRHPAFFFPVIRLIDKLRVE